MGAWVDSIAPFGASCTRPASDSCLPPVPTRVVHTSWNLPLHSPCPLLPSAALTIQRGSISSRVAQGKRHTQRIHHLVSLSAGSSRAAA